MENAFRHLGPCRPRRPRECQRWAELVLVLPSSCKAISAVMGQGRSCESVVQLASRDCLKGFLYPKMLLPSSTLCSAVSAGNRACDVRRNSPRLRFTRHPRCQRCCLNPQPRCQSRPRSHVSCCSARFHLAPLRRCLAHLLLPQALLALRQLKRQAVDWATAAAPRGLVPREPGARQRQQHWAGQRGGVSLRSAAARSTTARCPHHHFCCARTHGCPQSCPHCWWR